MPGGGRGRGRSLPQKHLSRGVGRGRIFYDPLGRKGSPEGEQVQPGDLPHQNALFLVAGKEHGDVGKADASFADADEVRRLFS